MAHTLSAIGLFMSEPVSAGSVVANRAVEVAGPQGTLRGTLTAPPEASAAVLIIPGSGSTDRDGNNPLGVAAAPYRLLAEGLAAQGIASLRIDKRGMFASAGASPDPNAVTIAEYVADVGAWARLLQKQIGTSCIWLLGHSEGGLVALSAAELREGICGLVLVATAGRPLWQVLREQLAANPANAPLMDQAFAAIASLEAGQRVDASGLPQALMPLFSPAVQAFLIDAFSRDPARLAAAWDRPILIVQGGRDIQVSAADAQRLHDAVHNSTLALFPDANHVLKAVPSQDRTSNLATYADPALPLASGIVERIAAFVKSPDPEFRTKP